MSPTTKVVIKCVLFGTGALLASLTTATIDNAITLGEAIAALSAGWVVGLGYGGISYGTDLEAVGKK